jgi:putative tricarboxylic transport membrane protein
MKKKIAIVATAAVAALIAGSSVPAAQALTKPDYKASAGDECLRVGKKAVGRGVEGTDLTCLKVTTGSFAGSLRWWYDGLKPLKNIDWTIPANPGGYSLTTGAISDALKAEGLLGSYSSTYKPGAGGSVGLGAFQELKGKPEAALITGIAMTGGLYSNKSKLNLLDSTPIAKMIREYDAVVVPANSGFRNINQFLAAIKASPNSVAIAGGSKGGIDHQVIGLLAEKAGVDATKLNYVVHSGGPEVVTSLLSGATQVGISGSSEFATYVAAGKLRVLGVSSAKALKGFKGQTFVQQGVDFTYHNWRGIMGPADLSEADRMNYLRVLDVLRSTPSWKAALTKNNWESDFIPGKGFKSFLETHIPEINKVIKGLGI